VSSCLVVCGRVTVSPLFSHQVALRGWLVLGTHSGYRQFAPSFTSYSSTCLTSDFCRPEKMARTNVDTFTKLNATKLYVRINQFKSADNLSPSQKWGLKMIDNEMDLIDEIAFEEKSFLAYAPEYIAFQRERGKKKDNSAPHAAMKVNILKGLVDRGHLQLETLDEESGRIFVAGSMEAGSPPPMRNSILADSDKGTGSRKRPSLDSNDGNRIAVARIAPAPAPKASLPFKKNKFAPVDSGGSVVVQLNNDSAHRPLGMGSKEVPESPISGGGSPDIVCKAKESGENSVIVVSEKRKRGRPRKNPQVNPSQHPLKEKSGAAVAAVAAVAAAASFAKPLVKKTKVRVTPKLDSESESSFEPAESDSDSDAPMDMRVAENGDNIIVEMDSATVKIVKPSN